MKNDINDCIIVVNYFASDLLSNIYNIATKYNFDLVIVDNSCDELERNALHGLLKDSKNLLIVFNDENIGFGRGCAVGIEHAKKQRKYDNYLFINPDITEIDLSNLSNSLSKFDKNKDAAYFQPLIVDGRESESVLGISLTSNFQVLMLYTFFKYILIALQKFVIKAKDLHMVETRVYIPSGAFFIVKADVLDKIGGFPQENFLYFEEWLFADRVKNLGMYGYIDKNLTVHHQIGYSTGLQYGAGSEKMLKYRKEAFLNTVQIIIDNIFMKLISKIIVNFDYLVRLIMLKIKRVLK